MTLIKFKDKLKTANLQLGDAVQLAYNKNGVRYHTVIITSKINGNFRYTARSYNRTDVDLWKKYREEKDTLLIYHMG